MDRYSDTDPHALVLLMSAAEVPHCVDVWRDEVPANVLQSGDLIPLPDAAIEAAGGNIEPAGQVDCAFLPHQLPEEVSAMLPAAPAAGCECVIVLRALTPEVSEDGFVSLGGFDPTDAKPLLRLLQDHEVRFEVEADHSELLQPGREAFLYLGMNPVGSRINIFVHRDHLGHARKLLQWLYPPEKSPATPRRSSEPAPGPPAKPDMEIYAPPSASIPWEERRDFYIRPGENAVERAADTDR